MEKFPMALIPSKFNASNTKFFFNPLCCWSDDPRNFKQIVNIATYKRLVDYQTPPNAQGPQNGSLKELLDENEKLDLEVTYHLESVDLKS